MSNNEERQALLALEDGSLFYGWTSSSSGIVCGEIVFNTSSTGYQEICTDPSYTNQIVLFTTSHIGNVGVNGDDDEFNGPSIKGLIAREISRISSSWRSKKSFISFINEHRVPWIERLDTRKLVKHIRKNGIKNGCMMIGNIDTGLAVRLANRPVQEERVCSWGEKVFFCDKFSPDPPKIFVYDFGVKSSLIQRLIGLGCQVHLISSHMSAVNILAYNPDGIILSNGAGNPASIMEGLEEIAKLIFSGVPVLGICLGCQLIALAAGASTKKMKCGHHGTNHPVYDINKKKVYMTGQNHNFVIDESTLPPEFEVSHVSLLDGSVQGIRSKNYPVMGFQGHPEGSPGPQDIGELFEEFLEMVGSRNAFRSLN